MAVRSAVPEATFAFSTEVPWTLKFPRPPSRSCFRRVLIWRPLASSAFSASFFLSSGAFLTALARDLYSFTSATAPQRYQLR